MTAETDLFLFFLSHTHPPSPTSASYVAFPLPEKRRRLWCHVLRSLKLSRGKHQHDRDGIGQGAEPSKADMLMLLHGIRRLNCMGFSLIASCRKSFPSLISVHWRHCSSFLPLQPLAQPSIPRPRHAGVFHFVGWSFSVRPTSKSAVYEKTISCAS